jgi:hypothetical protein
MKLTINIPDSNVEKAAPLIAYLKTLDYIEMEQEENFHIPENHKLVVRDRLNKNSNKDLLDWEQIKGELHFK